jgi:multiple sugar transport system substrate-binding protein
MGMIRVRLRFGVRALLIAGLLPGCGGPEPADVAPRQPFRGMKIVAGVLGDAAIVPGLESQRGEWAASSGAEPSFREAPADPEALKSFDLLIFPGDRLGDLVDREILLPLPEESIHPAPVAKEGETATQGATPEPPPDPFAFGEISAAYRDGVTKYGDRRYALPLGGTGLVLAFRRDAFDRPENKAAAKAAGINLEPPKTWNDLDALARFFHGRDWDGDGTADSGIALAWAADAEGVGDATFLSRAASVGQHRDQYSFLFHSDRMESRLTTLPFVEALQKLVDLAKLAPPGAAQFDADAARLAFRSGQVALLIDRAERASTWSEGKPIGVAALPGSERVFNPDRKAWETATSLNRPAYLPHGGGWLVGVVASTSHRDAAIDLAKYLAGPEVTNRLRVEKAFPMLPTRTPQLGAGLPDSRSAPGVEPRSWSDAVDRTVQAVRVIVGLRIPGAEGYLADLTKGRVAAASGRPAAEALKGVADAWDARTKSLGPKRQLWHYRRSLVRLVTSPDPPPRGE